MKPICATRILASSDIWRTSLWRGIINSKFETKLLKSITTYLVLAWILLIGAAISLVFIIQDLDPDRLANTIIFYLDIFALIFGTTLLGGYYLRQAFGIREFAWQHLQVSARQSLWFGIMLVGSFLLLSFDLFSWLNAALMILCLTFLESYFLFK
jgi:hypothetical protein